jgi:hypothetical protein
VFRGTRFPRNNGPALADIATTMGRRLLLTAVRAGAARTRLPGALRQLERCMARRALPGRATFDAGAKAIRFAYDPPTLHF